MMSKMKFSLTEDLVKIEGEPNEPAAHTIKPAQKNIKDRINIYVDKNLKEDLQIYCVRHKMNMTEIVEDLLREFLKK